LFATGLAQPTPSTVKTTSTNKFAEGEDVIRFTNSKGNTEKLNKFMQSSGPVYDPTLGMEEETVKNVNDSEEPFKFKGKIKIGSEVTDADLQREKFLQECRERADQEALDRERLKEEKQNVGLGFAENKPSRFTNSKGGLKNNGLFKANEGQNGELLDKEEKRTFTNSKKVKKENVEPVLDPNVPTVTKDQAIVTKVNLSTWD